MKTPEGFERIGGEIDGCSASVRIAAPDLDPDFITARLGIQPTFAARRGDKRESKAGTLTQPTGIWSLGLGESREWELSDAINALLNRLPTDIAVWDEIAALARIDMFCGLYLENWNRGAELPSELLGRLAERHFALGLDIYCDPSDPDADA